MGAEPGRLFRATHRVDTIGLPPLYALREQDALDAAEERWKKLGGEAGLGHSVIYLHIREKSGRELWEFWRNYP